MFSPRIVLAVLRHPAVWPEALAALRRVLGQRESSDPRRIPQDYLRFRIQTANGGEGAEMSADDVIDWLQWSRRFRVVVG